MKTRIIIALILIAATLAEARPRKYGISQTKQATRGLVAYYSMRNSGTTVYDEIGDNDGTAAGGVTFAYTNGLVGNGGGFDGGDDYIDTNFAWADGDTEITLSAWFKTTDTGGRIISSYINQPKISGSIDFNSSTMYLDVRDSDRRLLRVTDATGRNDGEWHHVVLTVSGTTLEGYIDGESIGTDTDGAFTGDIDDGNNFYIGDDPDVTARRLNGSIDEVRIYNVAKTPAEVHQLYRMGKTIFDKR